MPIPSQAVYGGKQNDFGTTPTDGPRQAPEDLLPGDEPSPLKDVLTYLAGVRGRKAALFAMLNKLGDQQAAMVPAAQGAVGAGDFSGEGR